MNTKLSNHKNTKKMFSELKELSVCLDDEHTAYFTVKGLLVTVKFRDSTGAPIKIESDLFENALLEFKKENKDFKPRCLMYPGPDWVTYEYERILWYSALSSVSRNQRDTLLLK